MALQQIRRISFSRLSSCSLGPISRNFSMKYQKQEIHAKKLFLIKYSSNNNGISSSFGLSKYHKISRLFCTASNETSEESTKKWETQRVWVRCNVNQYPQKQNGVDLNVAYIDTATHLTSMEKSSLPVLLALHGVPGTDVDWFKFLKPFAEQGYRIIIPNLPSYGMTKFIHEEDIEYYRHSVIEQSDFLSSFLRAIKVDNIKMGIAHSQGCSPLTYLAANSKLFESLVFLSPMHGHKPAKGMRPYWLIQYFGHWYAKGGILRWLTIQVYKNIIAKRNKVKESDAEEAGAIIQTGVNTNYDILPSCAAQLSIKKMPILYVHTTGDHLLDLKDSEEWAEILNIGDTNAWKYSEDGALLKEGDKYRNHTYLKSILFEGESHRPHDVEAYVLVLHREINGMLEKL